MGAGPAGLAAALSLQQQTNISCTVYELRSELTTLGGAIGIQPNGLRLLHRLGVYDAFAAHGWSASTSMTLHSLSGHDVGSLDMAGWAKEKTGFGYMRIKRMDIVSILLEAVERAGISIHFGKKLVKTENFEEATAAGKRGGVRVTFEDGSTDQADILLGCDGIHSFVRRSYVDPDHEPEYSGTSGLGAVVPSSVLSPATVEQVQGFEGTLTEDGMLAVNPCLPNKEELFMFFSKWVPLPESGHSRDGWELHRKEEVDGFKEQLLSTLGHAQGDWGNALRDLVHNTSTVNFYPVYRLPLGGRWSRGRCVLVGDAAHAMSPHAGQGVSMALEDVFLLSRLLADPERPIEEVFAKYDHIRRPRVNEIFEMAASNAQMRKKTTHRGLYLKELKFHTMLNVAWVFGLDKKGIRQGHLVYDIDEVPL
ncbi:hypothetical protein N7466_002232 [Penicillium verhagenii]|uniref:uncharacterized protein n=1 Tax=Penicillium verhagenii TaxID=1562060 RepID=UPI002544E196|nr:uncharacterized protein N7466_002232 [Penicillium verhagenii]KAJ5939098.1 hypothetical protein N7466_002232 [Penicillium verhagenii]